MGFAATRHLPLDSDDETAVATIAQMNALLGAVEATHRLLGLLGDQSECPEDSSWEVREELEDVWSAYATSSKLLAQLRGWSPS